jgi:hypothetical protein
MSENVPFLSIFFQNLHLVQIKAIFFLSPKLVWSIKTHNFMMFLNLLKCEKKIFQNKKLLPKTKEKKSKNLKFTRFLACNFFPRNFFVPSSTSLDQAYNFVLFIPHTNYEKKFRGHTSTFANFEGICSINVLPISDLLQK